MTDKQLENMNTWDVNKTESMQSWINLLENYNVYFSTPLDINFLMIENFTERYKSILGDIEGPQISMKDSSGTKRIQKIKDIESSRSESSEYKERINNDVRNTLKECGGDGSTYSDEQKELMIWYNYFFLNRGKPSTHILALTKMNELDMLWETPDVISKIIKLAQTLLLE